MQTIVGTPLWMAPEVVNPDHQYARHGGYGTKADIWSLGITVAELLNNGMPPWPDFESAWQALYHIGREDAQPTLPSHVSPLCHGFMRECVRHDPRERPSAEELLGHPWLAEATRMQDLAMLAFLDDPEPTDPPSSGPAPYGSRAGGGPVGLRPQFNGLDDEAATSLDAVSGGFAGRSGTSPRALGAQGRLDSSGFDEAIITVERQLNASSRASSGALTVHGTSQSNGPGAIIGSRRGSAHSVAAPGRSMQLETDDDGTMIVHESTPPTAMIPPAAGSGAMGSAFSRTGHLVIHDLSDDGASADGAAGSLDDPNATVPTPSQLVLRTPNLNTARSHARGPSDGVASNASGTGDGRRGRRGTVELNLELEHD